MNLDIDPLDDGLHTPSIQHASPKRTSLFAAGPHLCIGTALGRLQGTVTVDMLTGEVTDLTLGPDDPMPWHPGMLSRGYPPAAALRRGAAVVMTGRRTHHG